MKHIISRVALMALLLLAAVPARAQGDALLAARLAGAVIVAQDAAGTILGRITAADERESVFNINGPYGDRFAAGSLWNEDGLFGNAYGSFSARNAYSRTPPRIVKGGQVIGTLTTNTSLDSAITPEQLQALRDQFKSKSGC